MRRHRQPALSPLPVYAGLVIVRASQLQDQTTFPSTSSFCRSPTFSNVFQDTAGSVLAEIANCDRLSPFKISHPPHPMSTRAASGVQRSAGRLFKRNNHRDNYTQPCRHSLHMRGAHSDVPPDKFVFPLVFDKCVHKRYIYCTKCQSILLACRGDSIS